MDEVFRLALTRARVMDGENARAGIETPLTTVEALQAAQDAWEPYRDAACAAEAMLAAGDPAQRTVGAICLLRLTQARIADLQRFGME
ncbi:lysozyme inhibitor LprI family protein [Jannaschia sp. GRR-S6-38]|uniref:Lysozyme inhibitor LprI family protein n=1 Tax=Jannaschia ovalis TaxID=3038773 RepID=A0ABY8LJ06_9RHOB|nr:lysozyme inhibitor LprI family protein [Jannaschia sp. GRR-S6-38]WGH80400.1 lysozyme inhibitor LprI family protein [Jannaschia sp. GRR-S6-38]